jgi:high-affinity iron transporter
MKRLVAVLVIVFSVAVAPLQAASASSLTPAQAAEAIRSALVQAQLDVSRNPSEVHDKLSAAQSAYESNLAEAITIADPTVAAQIESGFENLSEAELNADAVAFAAARAEVWTALLAGSYRVVETALQKNDPALAQTWLTVREFRTATRFSRPGADATLAVKGAVEGSVNSSDALASFRADLLDTYQSRLNEALYNLQSADANNFPARRAELAALAEGYFLILAPAYGEQRGLTALTIAQQAFVELRTASLSNPETLDSKLQNVETILGDFRAAPLSPAEQSRRAGQLLRFIYLVPVEYGRGVADGRVIKDFEIQEAVTFHQGAVAAFSDLRDLLSARDAATTSQVADLFVTLESQLQTTHTGDRVADPQAIQANADQITTLLKAAMPEAWLQGSTQGDFDVIASLLDQMETAVRVGDYAQAESARLEAYAVMETGPEARIMVFAPQLKLRLEELFWNGQGTQKGLAFLIKTQASMNDIKGTRSELDKSLQEAQTTLGASSAPAAVATNAGLIVFREGLEAVLILASLMSSMKRAEERKYRQPMWIGTVAALAATILTWFLAHEVLQSLARYGEKLEAIVSLVAIGVLLLITNWFFHKSYWTDWIASFHAKKRQLITGEAGLWLGLVTLGFTSVYREGFETVLFLQALVLESGSTVVMIGVVAALLAVTLVGVVTFKLQVNLPYKKMLIVTGILIGGVLLQMVGVTTHVMQVVGWLPIHVIDFLPLPYWLGTWFGLYATWEGLLLQMAAALFVIGSYYLAEYTQKRALRVETSSPVLEAR